MLEAGQSLLLAIAMPHRRNGKDALVLARVKKVELFDVDQAREAYPCETDDCNLPDLAVKWGVTSMRCIVLSLRQTGIAQMLWLDATPLRIP
jgi:hypothetical protein